MSCKVRKHTLCMCFQWRTFSTWRNFVTLAIQNAAREGLDQTVWMRLLIQILAGLTEPFLICGWNIDMKHLYPSNMSLMLSMLGKASANNVLKYSRLSLSRHRLSRITAYLEVKISSLFKYEHLTTGTKILWEREEIAPKEQFLLFSTIFSIYL